MKRFVRFGLLTGLLVCGWNLSCFTIVSWLNTMLSLGIPTAHIRAYSGLFGVIILAFGIYLGMNAVKKSNDGVLTYKQAVLTGIGIAIISAVMAGIFAYLYCTVINPGYTAFMVNDAEQALMAAHKPTSEIQQQLEKVKEQFSTTSQVIQALVGQTVAGTVSSLIIALFTKSKTTK